jgi:hypothetical protein
MPPIVAVVGEIDAVFSEFLIENNFLDANLPINLDEADLPSCHVTTPKRPLPLPFAGLEL